MSKYTKERIEEAVKNSLSIADSLRYLSLRPVGGNYKWFRRVLKRFNVGISHFTGQGWSKGKTLGLSNSRLPLEKILVENSTYCSSNSLRKRLLKEGVKKSICERCLNEEWNNQKIPLELEHCNGNNTDNRIENLKLLCPNCHAQTPFYRGRNKLSKLNERRVLNRVKFGKTSKSGNTEPSLKKEEGVETLRLEPKEKKCECGKIIHPTSEKCKECEWASRKSVRPSYEQLIEDFKNLKYFVKVGKKYGVSDNAVRKWLKLYRIEESMVKIKSSAQTTKVE